MGSMNGSCSLTSFLVIGAAFLALNLVTAELDWQTCGKSLPEECGAVIFHRVVLNKDAPPSDYCCSALVKIGKPCHDAFARAHVKSHQYVRSALPMLKRSEEIWKECVQVVNFVGSPAGAPTSS